MSVMGTGWETQMGGKMHKVIRYYGAARNPAHGKPELVLVTRAGGRQVSQEWTGEVYATDREALAETGRRNMEVTRG